MGIGASAGGLNALRGFWRRVPFVACASDAVVIGVPAGLVTASRSIAGAHADRGGTPAGGARAEAERLRETAWRLA